MPEEEEIKDWISKYIRDVLLIIVLSVTSWALVTLINISGTVKMYQFKLDKIDENTKAIENINNSRYTEEDAVKDNNLILSKFELFIVSQKNIAEDIQEIKEKLK